jgi:D-aminopeptidase
MAEMVPSAKRKDGRTVSYVADNYLEAYKALRAMIALAGTNV